MAACSSGISVIVVGAGFAGLTAAIECHRKGHHVILFEKVAELKPLGDIISFGQNSSRVFTKWPGVWDALEPIIHRTNEISYFDWQGRFVTTQSFAAENVWGRRINGHRAEIHQVVLDHARKCGIDIRLGQAVESYFEEEDPNAAGGRCAGIVTAAGERFTADIVLAAEGVKSKGRMSVLGFDDKPQASGYAVYRAWFDSEELAANPLTRDLVANGDSHNGWIGRDVHFLSAAVKDGKEFSWVCTHRDESDIDESWQFPGKVEDVLKCLDGWAPIVLEQVRLTPPDRLFDYKLVFRDPLPTFVSPGGRIVLIGDSAHPFLPTSIQGASQAMEDGVVMAVCLEKAGRDGVSDAAKIFERIRYDRVHRIQATGVTTREQWHKADWDAIWKDPESLHLKREEWILNFDSEKDAYDRFDSIKDELLNKPEAT
jgi:2-polyprenyl-6-methoxyphenol hydroxylase-like FAD-dependent oxidoreductase